MKEAYRPERGECSIQQWDALLRFIKLQPAAVWWVDLELVQWEMECWERDYFPNTNVESLKSWATYL